MAGPSRESELLAHIARRSMDLPRRHGHVVVGPGDDAAVVRTPSGDLLLLTVDHVVVGRHVEAGTPVDLIARKAVARSVSDIAAMGGEPTWALGTGCLPKGYEHADTLFDAMHHWGEHWGCPLVGGDIATSDGPLVLTVTVGGRMTTRAAQAWTNAHGPPGAVALGDVAPVLRSRARPGDEVFITGPVGGSLRSGRHLTFEPRLEQGQLAAWSGSGVSAMIDISDGLGRDAGRVARASGVVIEIEAARIPLGKGATTWQAGVGDGEDHELLMCGSRRCFPACHPIGIVRACNPGESPGAWVTDPAGDRHEVSQWGWDHE